MLMFKQSVMKEEKIKFFVSNFMLFIPFFIILILCFIKNEIMHPVLCILTILSLLVFILSLLITLYYLEWYEVYDNKIYVKTIYGVKNKVYYDDILSIEKVEICLITRGMERSFFIFNDGRKNNANFLNINSCYNKKKFNLRIYKTEKLEKHIKDNIKTKF